jgi:hypothetical protein
MTAAAWICKSCGSEFETKGKRDHHHRTKHQNEAKDSNIPLTKKIRRSSEGKFVCECQRKYESVSALRKHQKGCSGQSLMNINSGDSDEGMFRRQFMKGSDE